MNTFYDDIIVKEGKVALAINGDKYKIHNFEITKELCIFENEFISVINGKTIDGIYNIRLILNKKNDTCVIVYKIFNSIETTYFGGDDFYCEAMEADFNDYNFYMLNFYYYDKNTIIHQSADATIEYFQKIENLKKYEDIKQMITNL